MPVVDTTIAIARRVRAHQPLLSGDRSHVYDQFVDRGMSIGQSTWICVGAQVVFIGAGLAATQAVPAVALGATVAAAGTVAFVSWRAGLLTVTDAE